MPRGNQTEQGSGKESVRGWSHIQGEVATAILTKQKFEQRPQALKDKIPLEWGSAGGGSKPIQGNAKAWH